MGDNKKNALVGNHGVPCVKRAQHTFALNLRDREAYYNVVCQVPRRQEVHAPLLVLLVVHLHLFDLLPEPRPRLDRGGPAGGPQEEACLRTKRLLCKGVCVCVCVCWVERAYRPARSLRGVFSSCVVGSGVFVLRGRLLVHFGNRIRVRLRLRLEVLFVDVVGVVELQGAQVLLPGAADDARTQLRAVLLVHNTPHLVLRGLPVYVLWEVLVRDTVKVLADVARVLCGLTASFLRLLAPASAARFALDVGEDVGQMPLALQLLVDHGPHLHVLHPPQPLVPLDDVLRGQHEPLRLQRARLLHHHLVRPLPVHPKHRVGKRDRLAFPQLLHLQRQKTEHLEAGGRRLDVLLAEVARARARFCVDVGVLHPRPHHLLRRWFLGIEVAARVHLLRGQVLAQLVVQEGLDVLRDGLCGQRLRLLARGRGHLHLDRLPQHEVVPEPLHPLVPHLRALAHELRVHPVGALQGEDQVTPAELTAVVVTRRAAVACDGKVLRLGHLEHLLHRVRQPAEGELVQQPVLLRAADAEHASVAAWLVGRQLNLGPPRLPPARLAQDLALLAAEAHVEPAMLVKLRVLQKPVCLKHVAELALVVRQVLFSLHRVAGMLLCVDSSRNQASVLCDGRIQRSDTQPSRWREGQQNI